MPSNTTQTGTLQVCEQQQQNAKLMENVYTILIIVVTQEDIAAVLILAYLSVFLFPADRQIRHRACALKDTVHAIITDELDEDFEKICEDIKESRRTRGEFCVYVCTNIMSCFRIGILQRHYKFGFC